MKKRNLRKIRLICLALLITFTVTFIHSNFTTKKVIYTSYLSYSVNNQDTLWEIAKTFNYSNQDLRDFIKDIQKINRISETIYPDQRIYIPINEDAAYAQKTLLSKNIE